MSCEIDTDTLIAEVEGRPHIWDPSHGDYKNREMRLKAWLDVCANIILGFEGLNEADQKKCVDKVQTRWKTARDAYFKSLTRIEQTRSRSAATKRPKYIYHEQLQFLGRLRVAPTERNSLDEPSEEQTDDVRLNVNTEKQPFKRKRPFKNTTFEDNLLTLLKDGKEKEEDDDDDRSFFVSLLPSVKTLNVDQKLLFRTQVLQLLMSIKHTNQANLNIHPPAPISSFHYPPTSFTYAPPSISQQHPNQSMQYREDPSVQTKREHRKVYHEVTLLEVAIVKDAQFSDMELWICKARFLRVS
ncbi:uncharacterized protein LOC124558022 [Schistocerca americana]|uniref:uncharacterized protein LOC124558022 n=1 Tax=Schistocerca americana TaxID=7009 RepID=UPI001F4F526A|nr:uncharacterized protein LOC124558022 [Schistocerca americana]